MRKILFFGILLAMVIGCSARKSDVAVKRENAVTKNDTVRIANDELQYEILIIEPGFDVWLASTARPRNYYSLTFLENKNLFWVSEWNRRVLDPFRYGNLYEMRIDYNQGTHYGFEVNYLLYNYFVYFQQHYRQKL